MLVPNQKVIKQWLNCLSTHLLWLLRLRMRIKEIFWLWVHLMILSPSFFFLVTKRSHQISQIIFVPKLDYFFHSVCVIWHATSKDNDALSNYCACVISQRPASLSYCVQIILQAQLKLILPWCCEFISSAGWCRQIFIIRLQEHHKNNCFQGLETDVAYRKLFMKIM